MFKNIETHAAALHSTKSAYDAVHADRHATPSAINAACRTLAAARNTYDAAYLAMYKASRSTVKKPARLCGRLLTSAHPPRRTA
jgi:hypothetical protein